MQHSGASGAGCAHRSQIRRMTGRSGLHLGQSCGPGIPRGHPTVGMAESVSRASRVGGGRCTTSQHHDCDIDAPPSRDYGVVTPARSPIAPRPKDNRRLAESESQARPDRRAVSRCSAGITVDRSTATLVRARLGQLTGVPLRTTSPSALPAELTAARRASDGLDGCVAGQ